MKKPNLFLIGMPKTGTTALYHFFSQHPEVFTPYYKEPHYFIKDKMSHDHYISYYKKHKSEKYLLDASAKYIYHSKVANRIKHYDQNAKIIAILREPISWSISNISQLYYNKNKKMDNFESAILKNLPSLLAKIIQSYKNIGIYHDIFGNSMRVIIYDDFKKNNQKVFDMILSFLNLTVDVKIEYTSHNKYKEIKYSFIKEIVDLLKIPHIFNYFFSENMFLKFCKIYHNFITVDNERFLNPKLKNKLILKFKPAVIRLNSLLRKRDLIEKDITKLWGYNGK